MGEIFLIVGAYFYGAIPLMLFLGRLKGIDLSREEDLHIALWRKVGMMEGVIGILFDFSKGILPVLIGFGLSYHIWAIAASGIAATAGQMWPVFRRFDGERGNTVGIGMLAATTIALRAYPVLLISLIPVITGVIIRTAPRFLASGQSMKEKITFGGPASRSLPLGMAITFATAPAVSYLSYQDLSLTLAYVAEFFIVIVVRRLTVRLSVDLGKGASTGSMLINRLLYDRSFV